jgi:superfamily I DNA/RNA helicase
MLIGEVVYLCVVGLESEDIPSPLFDHVVIDEYQDLTAAEQELVGLVWSGKGSLTSMGDDDQSIYAFRFNHPGGISDFHEKWQQFSCRDITFSENRRCGDSILNAANLMMAEAGSKKPPMEPRVDEQGI